MNTQSRWATASAVVVLGVVLAGCSSTSTPTPTTTRTVTATATATATSTATSPAASPTDTADSDTGTGAAGRAPDENAARCTTEHLTGDFAGRTAGASNVEEELHLTNTGTTDCTLQGWPGVSLVGEDDGTQIGQPAEFDRTTAHTTVALKPGTTAVARFHYVQADAFDAATCLPVTGDGFRVYPPGSKTSLFIPTEGVRGCSAGNETIFTVGAFH